MSIEIPQQEPRPKPPLRRAKRPVSKSYSSITDERGFLGGSRELDKAHIKASEAIDCGCSNTHETIGLTELFNAGITTPKEIFNTYDKYANISQKVHNSNREAGWITPSQEAEQILLFENKKRN